MGNPSGNSNKPEKLFGVKVNSSDLGKPLSVIMGTVKTNQLIFWIDGFKSASDSKKGANSIGVGNGGKGGGKGGQSLYAADVLCGLCAGPISGIGDVWSGQSWLASPIASESYTIAGPSYTYTPVNAAAALNNYGVTPASGYSASYSDYSAPGSTSVSNTTSIPYTRVAYPTTPSAGQYNINPTTNAYTFSSSNAGQAVTLAYSYLLTTINQQENDIVPAGLQLMVSPLYAFEADLGVVYGSGVNVGNALTRVNGTPTVAGTYKVSGSEPATYKFATADIGADVIITYQINNPNAVGQNETTMLDFTLANGAIGQSPYSFLTGSFPGAAIGYSGVATVLYEPMDLGVSGELAQNSFEVVTPDIYGGVYASGTPILDCNPVSCIYKVLTNTQWGLGVGAVPFPPAFIDGEGTWGQSGQATQITTTGGSDVLKTYIDIGTGVSGTVYYTSVSVYNNGAKTINVCDQFGNSYLIPPGTGQNVTWTCTSTGAADIQIRFQSLLVGDALSFVYSNAYMGTTPLPTTGYVTYTLSGYSGATLTATPTNSANSTAYNWFAANSFFISPVLDSQDTADSTMSKWLEAGMCAAFVSEGLLKLVPFGDTTQAGNGCTWTAPSTYVVALDDTCFVSKEGADPVDIKRTAWADAFNSVQVQWDNRANQYAKEITEESDQALINRYGSRIEDPQDWSFLHTLTAATFAANMRLKHGTYIRNTYSFTLPFLYSYLEPMDIVTLTTTSVWAAGVNNTNLGVTNLPIRITKVIDDPVEGLKIEAEDYPFGAGQPTLYNKGQSAAEVVSDIHASPGTSEVVLFEAAGRLVGFGGNQIWLGACGTSDNYGATNVWVSQDNVNYVQVCTLNTPAVIGELVNTFGVGTDPDTTNTLVVQLAENSSPLSSGTTTAADNDTMLCYVDGEVISYSACALTGQNTYTMGTYIRRGQLGTTISSHSIGGLFMRLDGSIFKYTYDPLWQGKTIYFKFQAVNNFGNNPQPLSNLTAVSFAISDTNSGVVDAETGLVDVASVSMTSALQSVSPVVSAAAVNNNLTNGGALSQYVAGTTVSLPTSIQFDVDSNGGLIDVLLYAGAGSPGPNGYIIRFDGRNTAPAGYMLKVINGSWGVLGTQLTANAATLTGWHTVTANIAAGGQMDVYVDGVHTATATDTTYTPTGALYYGCEVTTGAILAPSGLTQKTLDNIADGSNYLRLPLSVYGPTGNAVTTGGILQLKNKSFVAGTTVNPTVSKIGFADLPELTATALTYTTHGNPLMLSINCTFLSMTGTAGSGPVTNIGWAPSAISYTGATPPSPPTVTIAFTGGGGSGASASVSWGNLTYTPSGIPTSSTVWTFASPTISLSGGSGYSSAPTDNVTVASSAWTGMSSSGPHTCTITAATANPSQPYQVQVLMDGGVVMGPYALATDTTGHGTESVTQMVQPVAGSHTFQVQAYNISGSTMYSVNRSFSLVELG